MPTLRVGLFTVLSVYTDAAVGCRASGLDRVDGESLQVQLLVLHNEMFMPLLHVSLMIKWCQLVFHEDEEINNNCMLDISNEPR